MINKESLLNFWLWLTEGYPKDAFTEIRLMSIKCNDVYECVKDFAFKHPEITMRKNCQFFIQTFGDLYKVLVFRDSFLVKNSKVCYSLNPRFMVNNDISGEYNNLRFQDKVFFDIEKVNHEPLTDVERAMLLNYVNYINNYLKRYKLLSPTIVSSGGGMHLLYKTRAMLINDGRKGGYKNFINEIKNKMDNNMFHIDGAAIDLTRTVALVETINPKSNYRVHALQIGQKNDFFIRSVNVKKIKVVENKNVKGDIRKSLAWVILTNSPPEGDLNNLLLFYLKMLIRDFNVDYRIYEREINQGYSTKWSLNPRSGIQGKIRNLGTVVNWVKRHKEWCEQKNIKYQDYTY
jgi:hypothetical protein